MSRGKMKKDFAVCVGSVGMIFGCVLMAENLNHFLAFGVEFISSLVLLLFVMKSQIDQINIHLEDDLGLGPRIRAMIPKIALQLDWEKGRKGVGANDILAIKEAIRGRQFPIAIQFGGHKATIVVDCCFDGVPKLVSLGGGRPLDEFNATPNSGSSLLKA